MERQDIEITEAVVEAAARNEGNGIELVVLVLRRGENRITQKVLNTALELEPLGKLLLIASNDGREVVVKLLLEKGADIRATAKSGQTALHLAASNGHPAVFELLLEKGAYIEAKTNLGLIALHSAAKSGHRAVEGLLHTWNYLVFVWR